MAYVNFNRTKPASFALSEYADKNTIYFTTDTHEIIINGEAFGTAVPYDTLINLKVIPQFIVDNMYINGEYHLPMFFFESIICFLGFIIMLFIRRRKYIKVGQITGFYLIWYGVLRFIIEIFRI
jgi:phosphatidylglycerol:prolipoprotein diacylglycerol transferase